MNAATATAERIMDIAQRMVQTRGFNAFSYADISEQVGIRKASIHYYFPSKKDLGKELVARYRAAFRDQLDLINNETDDARRKLKSYARLYLDALRDDDRMCLCGMMASDIATLPEEVRGEVVGFFVDNEAWLTKVLDDGRKIRALSFSGPGKSEAQFFLASLQGAMLLARTYGDETRLHTIANKLLTKLEIKQRLALAVIIVWLAIDLFAADYFSFLMEKYGLPKDEVQHIIPRSGASLHHLGRVRRADVSRLAQLSFD